MVQNATLTGVPEREIPAVWREVIRGAEFKDYAHIFGQDPSAGTTMVDLTGFGDMTLLTYGTPVRLYCSTEAEADKSNIITVTGINRFNNVASQATRLNAADGRTKQAIGTANTKWKRIFEVKVTSVAALFGDLYVYQDDTVVLGVPQTQAKIQAKCVADFGRSQSGVYTVPEGKEAFAPRLGQGAAYGGGQEFQFFHKPVASAVWQLAIPSYGHLRKPIVDSSYGYYFDELTDIKLRGRTLAPDKAMSAFVPLFIQDKSQ